MPDRESVINIYANCILNDKQCCSDCYTGGPGLGIACRQQVLTDALYLLKDQEHKDKMFHALEDDWKRLKELLKEQPEIVRCKDCKHHLECDYWIENGDDWFCAEGERKDG